MIAFSIEFVNKNDNLFRYASHIPDLIGYDTVVCHGDRNSVFIYDNQGVEIEYSAEEFAMMIKNSLGYAGKNIRLISCNTGADENGFAQNLANFMGVNVLAPTEAIWVNSFGKLFISNFDVLAEMWFEGKPVKETGEWKLFYPKKGAKYD